MSSSITKFSKRIRHKLHEVEQRLDALKVTTEKQAEQAGKAIHKHVAALEDDAHKAKDRLDQANADLKAWVDDAEEAVAGWKATFDAKMLQARAERSESHADAALVVALASVDQAEKAMLSASLARAEAEAVVKQP
jgi:DNA polymerase I-like protein with 3'-5' exonuclease and polymerase domains